MPDINTFDKVIKDPDFLALDRIGKKQVLDRFFANVVSKSPEFSALNADDIKSVTNRYYSRVEQVIGSPRAEELREQYPSEKIFGPITEGVAQVATGLRAGPLPAKLGLPIAGATSMGIEIARQGTQALMGEPGAPKTFGESIERQGKAFAAGMVGEALGRGVFKAGGKIFGPAELNANQRLIKDIADKYDVPMTPADIKGTKLAGLLESISEKSLIAGNIIQKFRAGQLKSFNNIITDLAAKGGGKITREQAGEMTKEILETRAALAKQKTDALYQAARESVTDQYQAFVDNSNVAKLAKNMVDEEKFFGPELKSKVIPVAREITENKTNFTSLDGIMALRSKLKEMVDNEYLSSSIPGRTTPAGRKYSMLLGEVEKDLDNYYSNVNPDAKGLYNLAKASYKEEIGKFGTKEAKYIARNNPEKIVDYVIKPNNVTAIKNVKNALGEKGFEPIKQRFLLDVIESTNIGGPGATPIFKPSAMDNMLGKYEPETLGAIFNKAELKEIEEIAKLSSAMQTAERVAGNPSGTSQIATGSAFLSALWVHPGITALGIGVPTAISYAITSPIGRKIMIEGLKSPPGSAEMAKAVTRFSIFAKTAQMRDRKK